MMTLGLRRRKGGSTSVALLGVFVLLATACAGNGESTPETDADETDEAVLDEDEAVPDEEEVAQDEDEVTSIRLGTSLLSPAYMTAYIGHDQGIFSDHGLDVEVTPFSGDPSTVQALLAGEIDVMESGFPALSLTYGTENELVIFAETVSFPHYTLHAREAVADMVASGDAVGGVSAIGGLDYVMAKIMLEGLGHDPDSVDYTVAGPPAERAAALAAGRIDFVLSTPPGYFRLEDDDLPVQSRLADVLDQFAQQSYTTTPDFYENNTDAIERLVAAQRETSDWIRANPDEATDILMEWLDAPEEERSDWERVVDEYAPWLGGESAPGIDGPSIDSYRQMVQFNIDAGEIDAENADDVLEALLTFYP